MLAGTAADIEYENRSTRHQINVIRKYAQKKQCNKAFPVLHKLYVIALVSSPSSESSFDTVVSPYRGSFLT